ncbi:MAG: hypothetical protein OEQ53_21340 [Saprospiraceae bacterium]|nr:hypothetical protein [Saprospiraceae bacterium]
MKMILYQDRYDLDQSIQDFLDVYFRQRMEYFASDLFEVGLSPAEISTALQQALLAAKSAGLNVRQHFHKQYSDYRGALVSDCRLSRLGYGLLLLNANVSKRAVAKWQVKVLEHFLSK